MKILKTLFLISAMAGAVSTATATSINGSINFAGGFATDTGNLGTATQFTSFNTVHVDTGGTGDYAAATAGSTGDAGIFYSPLQFAPAGSETATPFTLWSFSIGGTVYKFTLS